MDQKTIGELNSRVDAALAQVFRSRQMPLYDMMSYHMGWRGRDGRDEAGAPRERSHGVACLTACLAAGGDPEDAIHAAAAVELVSNFAQIHDDVQGGQPQRDGRDAVWWIWGPAQAINAGDGMHALARLTLFRLPDSGVSLAAAFRAVQLLDQASLELCEGRFLDLEAQERIDLTAEGYLAMAAAKTGALYACAMQLGALVSGADTRVEEAMARCGASVGLALQVRWDVRELWPHDEGASRPSPEVLNKKKLLPVVYALSKADISQKRRLGDIYFKRVLEADDVSAVREVLEGLGAREYCEDLARRYSADARDAVARAGLSCAGVDVVAEYIRTTLGE